MIGLRDDQLRRILDRDNPLMLWDVSDQSGVLHGSYTSYAAIKALDTARNVFAQCGDMTVEVQGGSRNVAGVFQ